MYIQRKRVAGSIRANADVAPEATELLFDATDVAELIAEVTGEDVVVTAEDGEEAVTFEVAGEEFTVEPEGTEEVLEASTRFMRGKKPVSASSRRQAAPPAGRTVKKVPGRK